jgi:hypothetical protein
VAHGGTDIPPCGTTVGAVARGPVACDGHTAITDGGRDIPPWATAARTSAKGHDGNRPAAAMPHCARNCCLYNVEIQPKMS